MTKNVEFVDDPPEFDYYWDEDEYQDSFYYDEYGYGNEEEDDYSDDYDEDPDLPLAW